MTPADKQTPQPGTCSGLRSRIRPWLPDALCRSCLDMAHLFAPAQRRPAVTVAAECTERRTA